jgi:hypothetical protein
MTLILQDEVKNYTLESVADGIPKPEWRLPDGTFVSDRKKRVLYQIK